MAHLWNHVGGLAVSNLTTLPSTTTRRTFSTTPRSNASVLFALSSLSNSRETQHFNKRSRLSRVEHSPSLKLIQTSEIEPFPLPTPPPKLPTQTIEVDTEREARRLQDERALEAGRAVLADHAQQVRRLRDALEEAGRRETQQMKEMEAHRQAWEHEARRLRGEIRIAGVWIVASVATATALACWRFWPQTTPETGEMGRRIAEKASRALNVPASAIAHADPVSATMTTTAPVAAAPSVEPALAAAPTTDVATSSTVPTRSSSWWRGWFWKQ